MGGRIGDDPISSLDFSLIGGSTLKKMWIELNKPKTHPAIASRDMIV